MTKKYMSLILFIIIAPILFGCSTDEETCEVTPESIKQLIEDLYFSWKIENIDTVKDGDIFVSLKNEGGAVGGLTVRNRDSGEKSVSLSFYFPQSTVDDFTAFNEKDLEGFVKLMGVLYGNPREVDSVYKEFLRDAGNEYYINEKTKVFIKRLNDDHYQFKSALTLLGSTDIYLVNNMFVANSIAYEKYLSSLADAYVSEGRFPIKNGVISDIIAQNDIDKLNTECFIVKGSLADIQTKTIDGKKFMTAKLSDNTNKLDVFLIPTTLNEDELSQNRNHYVMLNVPGFSENLIQISILDDK